jgi:polysaccharide export outer membrane protein
MTSCTSSKKVIYLNNLQDSLVNSKDSVLMNAIASAKYAFDTKIQKNDQLSITFGSSNPADVTVFNSGTVSAGGAIANSLQGNSVAGYLVESDGNIQLPFLGKVKAEGLTRMELQEQLTKGLGEYTKNPIVNVRFLNYSFSVLGEVQKPGKFSMSSERTTILDAIGLAGDLTSLGKRENILIVREVNGERKFGRVNLLSKDIFASPYFYVQTNDVMYVEPVNVKFASRNGVTQYLGVIAVSLSLVLSLISLTK